MCERAFVLFVVLIFVLICIVSSFVLIALLIFSVLSFVLMTAYLYC